MTMALVVAWAWSCGLKQKHPMRGIVISIAKTKVHNVHTFFAFLFLLSVYLSRSVVVKISRTRWKSSARFGETHRTSDIRTNLALFFFISTSFFFSVVFVGIWWIKWIQQKLTNRVTTLFVRTAGEFAINLIYPMNRSLQTFNIFHVLNRIDDDDDDDDDIDIDINNWFHRCGPFFVRLILEHNNWSLFCILLFATAVKLRLLLSRAYERKNKVFLFAATSFFSLGS